MIESNISKQFENISDADSSSENVKWEDLYPGVVSAMFGLDIVNSIISTLGCIGNVFTMLIISKWDYISSGAAFMFALALTDLVGVFYDGIVDGVPLLFGFYIQTFNDFTCSICAFLLWATSFASFYMTVLFSFDKCLAVVFPFKYRQYGKPKVCIISTAIL